MTHEEAIKYSQQLMMYIMDLDPEDTVKLVAMDDQKKRIEKLERILNDAIPMISPSEKRKELRKRIKEALGE